MIGCAWISKRALDSAIIEAERSFPTETGGVLMGYWVKPLAEVVITGCTTPGLLARHTSIQYVPDCRHDEAEIEHHYHKSGRLHTYLGDWHSHPEESPYLSPTDTRTLRRIAGHAAARIELPLMAILGGCPGAWDLAVWCHRGRRSAPVSLLVKLF